MSDNIYLKLDGVNGDVTDKGYENSIRVWSYWFAPMEPQKSDPKVDIVRNPASVIGVPNFSKEQLHIVADYGTASPGVYMASVSKQFVKQGTLQLVREGKKPMLMKKYQFYGIRILQYQIDSRGGTGLPVDTFILQYLVMK